MKLTTTVPALAALLAVVSAGYSCWMTFMLPYLDKPQRHRKIHLRLVRVEHGVNPKLSLVVLDLRRYDIVGE